MSERYLSAAEVADRVGLAQKTIYRLARDWPFAVWLGTGKRQTLRVSESGLAAFMATGGDAWRDCTKSRDRKTGGAPSRIRLVADRSEKAPDTATSEAPSSEPRNWSERFYLKTSPSTSQKHSRRRRTSKL